VEKVVVDLLDQFERGKISRRQLVQSLTFGAMAVSAGAPLLAAATQRQGFKASGVNHISFGVADYGRTRDFYAELFGMPVTQDNGKQCYLTFGNTVLIPRKTRQPDNKPLVDHIAYTIDNWDKKRVEEELKARGLDPKPDDNSFHFKDPDGYDVQIAGKNFMNEP
jgi:catechol 2,3-dioxygenase-like lactoylglutathione lyase family enzyme